jgi:hypothetical protein
MTYLLEHLDKLQRTIYIANNSVFKKIEGWTGMGGMVFQKLILTRSKILKINR